jgi:hypothetical protein
LINLFPDIRLLFIVISIPKQSSSFFIDNNDELCAGDNNCESAESDIPKDGLFFKKLR